MIVGTWDDSSGVEHGFQRAPGGKIASFDVPGSTLTNGNGINNKGEITGPFIDANGTTRGFLRIP